jgi:sigma-B regulation protein RsbU (phosphoserine phosphatase)
MLVRPSLRAFLFAGLSIAALAPILYFGATQVAHWRQVQRQDADKELRFAAEGLARTLGQALEADAREITALAKTVALQGMADRGALQTLLHQHCSTYPSCLGVNISGTDGLVFVMEPPVPYTARLSDREYYRSMMRTGRTSVSGVEFGRISRVPTIHVCAPVWTPPLAEHPEFAGAIVGAIGLEYLQGMTTRAVEIFGDMHARVLDGRGRLVIDSSPLGAAPLADLSGNPIYAAVPDGRATLREGWDERRQKVRVALARVPERGVAWTVAVMRSTKTIEERASRARISTLVAIAAALLLGLLFAYLLSTWLARPIAELADYAGQVARGEPAPVPAPARTDAREVTDLIETVSSMVAQLQSQAEELREREREQILLAQARQELEIAERIQAGILPKQVALPGFEFAAQMIPAEAVGGDYYEVLPGESGFWIASGDVSGHGLDAGLVTLMLQSALAAVAIHSPRARPGEILKAVNRLLVENIRRRLGRDDHVTLVLMHVDADGSFVFAGGHEPLLVLRAADGTCEEIDTPGPWLGILPGIGQRLPEGRGRLERGDLLLFHSDGIVEAGALSGEPFGLDRLRATVEGLRDQPVEAVCRAILREARAWSPGRLDDDMTIVAVRRAR